MDPDQKRYLIVAAGRGIFVNKNGKPDWKQREELPFVWPDQRDTVISEIERWAPTADIWLCPYLMRTPKRAKGNSAWRQLAHSDCDRGAVDIAKVNKVGGFVVWSGTPGHGHVYVPLTYTLRLEQHQALERGLVAYLDGDPAKVNDNDLLRPPNTWNHKNTLNGGPALPVTLEQP